MKVINGRSRRWGYDGWALRVIGALRPIESTTVTTREEARELRRQWQTDHPDLFQRLEVVKVRITVEAI